MEMIPRLKTHAGTTAGSEAKQLKSFVSLKETFVWKKQLVFCFGNVLAFCWRAFANVCSDDILTEETKQTYFFGERV